MTIEIKPVEPGELITAFFMNEVIKALVQIDVRLTKLEEHPIEPGGAIVVTSVSPSVVREGDDLTIGGLNFGSSKGTSAVTFDGQPPALYRSWKDSEIVCVVPKLNPPVGGRLVIVEVTNFLTSSSRPVTVKPREQLPTGSFEVEFRDASPDPITAGTDNDFQITITSDANIATTATLSASLQGQGWPLLVLSDQKVPIPAGQLPIQPQETKVFYVRVSIPPGTNQAPFKLTASAAAPGVDTGTTGPMNFTVGQFADPDKTFSLAPTGSQPPDALVGSAIKAKAGSNTDVMLQGEFSVAGSYEITLAAVPEAPAGWQFGVTAPAANAAGKHVILVSQQQLDHEADGKVSGTVTFRVRPQTATAADAQLRLVARRSGETKSRTHSFDIQATA